VAAQVAAQVKADRLCPHCGQAAGKGRFCIECGRPLAAAAQAATPAAVPAFAAAAPTAAPAAVEEPAAQRPFPVREQSPAMPEPQRPAAVQPGVPNFARAMGQGVAAQAAQPVHTTPALPPHVAMQAAAREPEPVSQPLPVHPGAAQQSVPQHNAALAHREAPGQRPPVTSLNADLARLGVPQAPRRTPDQVQAKPAPAPVQGGGVEF
jgi:hypothetical protein